MNAKERLAGVRRTLDALGPARACLEKIEAPAVVHELKEEAQAAMENLVAALEHWHEYETEKLA